jgi:pilus assembly protein CpaC
MNSFKSKGRPKSSWSTAVAAAALALGTMAAAAPAQAQAQSGSYKPTSRLVLSAGEGDMINLPRSVSSVWTSNPKVADIYVNGTRQINVFGKEAGNATVIATAADGSVVYSADVLVSQNIGSVNDMLRAAMPESNVTVTALGGIAVINGTVANVEDATQAQQMVKAMLNPGVKENEPLLVTPINRLKVATPLQVTLKVRVVEVNRSVIKQMGINLLTSDPTSGFQFGVAQGEGIFIPPADNTDPDVVPRVLRSVIGSTFFGSGKLFGIDVLGSLDIAAKDGLVTILAEPNLTAVTGETATFLAGGEFPIPIAEGLGSLAIEYKQFGVALAFTPIVLGDGRISMRLRPEVSELSDEGAITLNGYKIPALTVRRAETTVELGSGQSFMIAGLLRNGSRNTINKAPFLGDIPVLGALFRSTQYQRQETELVIVVTPYLVRPANTQMATPTDGFRSPDDASRDFLGQQYLGKSGSVQPQAVAAPTVVAPAASVSAAPGFKM